MSRDCAGYKVEDALVRLAIRDAMQIKQERVCEEAARWLWKTAPGVAAQANVPTIAVPGR